MTSRDLAPLPPRRIGRVTDALSLRLGTKAIGLKGRGPTGAASPRRAAPSSASRLASPVLLFRQTDLLFFSAVKTNRGRREIAFARPFRGYRRRDLFAPNNDVSCAHHTGNYRCARNLLTFRRCSASYMHDES